jgi:hypothetical protein
MSQPKFNRRWLDATPELLRMGDLEPEDTHWVCHPILRRAPRARPAAGAVHGRGV